MAYGNLGGVFGSLGQYDKAVEFHTKHLNISRELGDRVTGECVKRNLKKVERNAVQHAGHRSQ